MPSLHKGFHSSTLPEVGVYLDEWLRPKLLRVVFLVDEAADVVRFYTGKAACKV
jgi:hypothetical protein